MTSVRFATDYEVLSRNADANGRLSVRALVAMLFDSADLHASQWRVSLGQLAGARETWVLSRLHLRLDRQPLWDERITVETWPTGSKRILAGRDFTLSTGGAIVGRATTLWLMIDRETRRPVSLPDFVRSFEPPAGSPIVASRGNWPEPGPEPHRTGGLPSVRATVDWDDLDLNRHAGALSYLDWLFRPIPEALRETARLAELDILFKSESFLGDEVVSRASEIVGDGPGSEYTQVVENAADGRIVAAARTLFRPSAG